ncbi:hypothetical protein BKA61DRAFT_241188 [Leptodontidium sp. MPI-SDFR-AT-0119]|nr:hypothetical protein BKA61DRAFT_241188 [Leptodontidium sp. MPI-SDFR-AT-0119]
MTVLVQHTARRRRKVDTEISCLVCVAVDHNCGLGRLPSSSQELLSQSNHLCCFQDVLFCFTWYFLAPNPLGTLLSPSALTDPENEIRQSRAGHDAASNSQHLQPAQPGPLPPDKGPRQTDAKLNREVSYIISSSCTGHLRSHLWLLQLPASVSARAIVARLTSPVVSFRVDWIDCWLWAQAERQSFPNNQQRQNPQSKHSLQLQPAVTIKHTG